MTDRVYISTFGCQMNEYDTELVRSILTDAGYSFTEDETEADVIMLNTCSVRETAHRKVYGQIHEIRHKRKGKPALVGILGCMATGLRDELLKNEKLGLDFVVGPDSYKRLPEILAALRGHMSDVIRHTSCDVKRMTYDVSLSEYETYSDITPKRAPGVNAWVAVMRGCNNFCSFCIVPYTRGRERSRSVANIVDEVRRLAGEGYPQVTLLGQNVNSYCHEGADFAALLDAVSRVDGIRRIRFTSPHPKDFPDSLLKVMAESPKICKQIHLPLQAGNDRVLKLMQRHYTGDDFIRLVDKIRKACPQVALSTDVIVGFPTETEEEFKDTLRVMETVQFDTAFMFKYSVRPNTKAARELKDDVTEKDKTDRIVRLNELQASIAFSKNKAHVGKTEEILIEEADGESAWGRNEANKIVKLKAAGLKPGQFLTVRITRATPHQLIGEAPSEPGSDKVA